MSFSGDLQCQYGCRSEMFIYHVTVPYFFSLKKLCLIMPKKS